MTQPQLERRLLAERFGEAIRQVPYGVAAAAVILAVSWPVFWAGAQRAAMLAALLLIVAGWIGTLGLSARYRRLQPADTAIPRWLLAADLARAIHGGGFGIYSLAVFASESLPLQVLDVALMFGLAVGSLVTSAPLFRSNLAFTLPCLVPVIVRSLLPPSPEHLGLGLSAIVGMAFLLFSGRRVETLIVASMTARFENAALVAALERQKALAEAASLQKSRFLAAASHDLRQPLQALNLFLEAARGAADEAERTKIYARAERAAANLTGLFDGLLELSRLEAGAVEPRLQPVALRPLVERLATEHAAEAHSRGLAYRLRLRDVAGHTDPLLCEQILRNLLGNALRYTQRGGILVSLRTVRDRIAVDIHDTGVGIAAEHQNHVFEAFYQIGNPQRDRRKGVGLGLAIAHHAAQLLGHRLELRSTLGRGSRFRLLIPRATPQEVTHEDPTTRRAYAEDLLAGTTIAVIDDEPDVLVAIQTVLQQSGCIVYAADTADNLLAQLQANEAVPDLILSDYRLGNGATGSQAISQLRRELGSGIPALLMTGDGALGEELDTGPLVLDILRKPVAPDVLRHRIAQRLAN